MTAAIRAQDLRPDHAVRRIYLLVDRLLADDSAEIVVLDNLSTGLLANLARHAFGLAQAFNQFYHRNPILQEPDEAIRNRRLAIARIFRREMARLLALLGIPEPARM